MLLGRCVANNHPAAWRPLLLPQASTHTCTLCPHTVAQHWQPPPPPPYPLVPVNYCDRHQFLPRAVRRDTGLDSGQPVVSLGRSLGCWLMGGAELGDGWALPAPKVCDSKFLRNTVRFKGDALAGSPEFGDQSSIMTARPSSSPSQGAARADAHGDQGECPILRAGSVRLVDGKSLCHTVSHSDDGQQSAVTHRFTDDQQRHVPCPRRSDPSTYETRDLLWLARA